MNLINLLIIIFLTIPQFNRQKIKLDYQVLKIMCLLFLQKNNNYLIIFNIQHIFVMILFMIIEFLIIKIKIHKYSKKNINRRKEEEKSQNQIIFLFV